MPNDRDETYICALSGIEAPEDALVEDAHEDDDLHDLPVGWSRITLERRVPNPEYQLLLQDIEAIVAQSMSQIPPEHHAEAEPQVRRMIRRQFYAELKDTQPYLTETGVAFIAPPEVDPGLAESYKNLLQTLNLPLDG